jgi:signal transduction histidine kinase
MPAPNLPSSLHATFQALIRPRLVLLSALPFLIVGLQPAVAMCIDSPFRNIADLQNLVAVDPSQALIAAARALGTVNGHRLEHEDWFWVVKADALSNLSRAEAAREAASTALARFSDSTDDVRAELSMIAASNGFEPAQRVQSFAQLDSVLKRVEPNSLIAACLTATMGDLARMSGDPVTATARLTQAYRASGISPSVRLYVNIQMAKLMRYAGDRDTAIAIQREVIAAYSERKAWFSLATVYGFLGIYLNEAEQYDQALRALGTSQQLASRFNDRIGDAYRDAEKCRALLGLERLHLATTACSNALKTFIQENNDSAGNVRILLARIALKQHQPQVASAWIDEIFRVGETASSSVNARAAYEVRAQTRAALRDWKGAFADQAISNSLYRTWNDTERDKRDAVLRTRFRLDRQVERNDQLHREISLVEERNAAERQRLLIAVVLATIIVLLLIAGLAQSRRRRQQLHAARETAEQAATDKARFLADMSHDIRAPIGTIHLLSARLARIVRYDDAAHATARDVARTSERVVNLLDAILQTSKLEAVDAVRSVPIDLRQLMTTLLEEATTQASAAIPWEIEIDDRLPAFIKSDPEMLSRLVLNLLSNAVRHGGCTPIRLRASHMHKGQDRFLRIEVADRGAGLPHDDHARLFDRHIQGRENSTGTGLGLSINRAIVARLGGESGCRQRPKGGAAFWFTLPLAFDNEAPEGWVSPKSGAAS